VENPERFEEGKRLIIEGFEEILGYYRSYMKILRGYELLGIEPHHAKKAKSQLGESGITFDIGFQTLISDLREARNASEVDQAIHSNMEFMRMISPEDE